MFMIFWGGAAGGVFSAKRAGISVVLADQEKRNVQLAKLTVQEEAIRLVKEGMAVDGVSTSIATTPDRVEQEARSLAGNVWENIKMFSNLHVQFQLLPQSSPIGGRQ